MIRTSLLALLLLAPTAAPAQDWAKKMFPTTSHDFGTVARGAKVEFDFKFSNLYEETVHVASVRSSCGCTTPTITKDTLKTYEESAIVAVFNTRAFLGQKNATLTVTIDQPFYAEVQLHVSGFIRSDVVLNPGSADLGTVDQGTAAEKKIAVSYAGRSDWKITEVKSSNPHLTAAVTETGRSAGQVTYDLVVQLKPTAPCGYFKDQILLMTNDYKSTEFPVDVEAKVTSEITVSPSSLFMGVLQPGQKVTKQLVVQGKKPFRIVSITCGDPGFEFQTGQAAKTVHLVPVTFTAGSTPGKITQKIQIETDLGPLALPDLSAYAQVLEAK